MKKTFIALALITLAGASFANDTTCNGTLACSGNPTVGDNRNGQVVGTGQIANGGKSSSTSSATGGAGGAGGSASIAAGAVSNTNSNTIAAGAVQNTVQGSTQSQTATGGSVGNTSATGGSVGNTSSSSGGNTLTGGAVSNTNTNAGGSVAGSGNSTNTNAGGSVAGSGNSSTTVGGQTTTVGGNNSSNSVAGSGNSSTSVGGQTTSINIADNANTVAAAEAAAKGQVEAARLLADATRDQKIRNTPSIGLGALTSSNDTCMGSTNAGGSGPGFSLAIGSTWVDGNCKMLKNSRELWNMGMRGAAMALMCNDSANRDALELTGYVCPQTERENGRKLANGQVEQPQYTDPIVRARLGLAPLK